LVGIDKIFNKKKVEKTASLSKTEHKEDIYDREDVSEEERSVVPDYVRKKAALLSAHLLLPEGARVVDTGCDEGHVAYILAQLNPRASFIGIDHDKEDIDFANKYYKLPNLSFVQSDLAIEKLEDETLDAVINSNILHGVYSKGGYNPDEVSYLLGQQVKKLREGGTMLIRDYMMPAEDAYVLLELPATPSLGKTPREMSDADLLILFSQSARPLPSGDCEGFFIEEIKPKNEGTRLFRLHHKWALEFLHRKDERRKWEREIKTEYTFFTYRDFQREFAKMGMRMVFSAPYWNPWVVEKRFQGKFRMYSEDGKLMQNPATNYFIVAQKTSGKKSILIEEKRPSQKPTGDLSIITVQDKASGKIHEIVKPNESVCDIIPFRLTPDNRMIVFINSGSPRPVINAVPRGNNNLDGKRWSGHLIEPISMSTKHFGSSVEANKKIIFDYIKHNLGLRPKGENAWYVGDTYFPAPDQIDEAIEPVFVEVENPYRTSWDFKEPADTGFIEKGHILELDGSDIISASQVGLMPEPRLEMYVMDLFRRYKIVLPPWVGEAMPEVPRQKIDAMDPDEVLKELAPMQFFENKNLPKNLKPVKSVFVEDATVGSTTRGITTRDIEFIITEDGVENIAVVLPLTREWDNKLMVMLEPQIMPIPNRRGGDGAMLNAPSFKLPKEVTTIEEARFFVAEKFSVPIDKVVQLGESYFTHVGVMPQRIYPFMVASNKQPDDGSNLKCFLAQDLAVMQKLAPSVIKLVARVQMSMDYDHGMSMKNENNVKYKGFSLATEKVALDARNNRVSVIPSLIMGEVKKTSLKAHIKNIIDPPKPSKPTI